MADDSTQYSTRIPYDTEAQRLWLLAKFEALEHSDEGSPCCLEELPEEHALWVYTDQDGSVNPLLDLVADFQQTFGLTMPWTLTWANTCSRPIYDAFSGGAAVVLRGQIQGFHLGDLTDRWIREQTTPAFPPSRPRRATRPHTKGH